MNQLAAVQFMLTSTANQPTWRLVTLKPNTYTRYMNLFKKRGRYFVCTGCGEPFKLGEQAIRHRLQRHAGRKIYHLRCIPKIWSD